MSSQKDIITFLVPMIIERDNGKYHAFCPVLKGLHTYGETEAEIEENSKNAIIAYLDSLIKHGDPIPLCIIEKEKPKFFKHRIKEYKENFIKVPYEVPCPHLEST